MALFPRFTRPAVRITIEALAAYLPQLSPDGQQIARETIGQLQYTLDSANRDNRRRADENRAASGVDVHPARNP